MKKGNHSQLKQFEPLINANLVLPCNLRKIGTGENKVCC